ncbi:MAG TPA: hypothetical protein VKM54_17725 [Myxococcota bacterium]|nr:hypothetical protein [Myxococcota bacterium]
MRGVVLVAPYLPWRSSRWLLSLARFMSPSVIERLPLQHAWPLLRHISVALESRRELEHDWLARASARVGYYLSCPATRANFISASRELAHVSAYNQGMMGYKTPNIDRIAHEGALFTDWYGQQSCTAGRARDHCVPWREEYQLGGWVPRSVRDSLGTKTCFRR